MEQCNRKFLTIEGIEGVGKSTALNFIHQYLQQHHEPCVITREPGGTLVAEHIRQILLSPQHKELITSETELLLMFASRSQHIAEIILPALRAGKWVVSDRFVDASYAYQGGGRKIPLEFIELLDKWVVKNLTPRRTILLDAPPEIGLARAKHRGNHDRIEQEKMDFFERVREVYLARADTLRDQYRVVDATVSIEQVQQALKKILDELM